jgi:hypothetical protein
MDKVQKQSISNWADVCVCVAIGNIWYTFDHVTA